MAPLTRRQAQGVEKTIDDVKTSEDVPVEEPASSRGKRKSTEHENDSDDEGGVPLNSEELSSPKRQRLTGLAVRTREDESTETGRKTNIEVEIPTSSMHTIPRRSPVPDSEDDGEGIDSDPEVEPLSASKQLEEEASQKLASQSVEPEHTPMPKPKGKHITFGDDDDVENFVAAAAAAIEAEDPKDEEEGSDDDDDAPEAVSTQAVAKKMQEAAQAAEEAAEKQAASLKRKRQEKDNLYKQQAERRKRARGVELHQSKSAHPERASSAEDGLAHIEDAITSGRRRAEKYKLPTHLPAEFLTDSSSEDEDEAAAPKKKQRAAKPKKINFDDDDGAGPKPPRDRTVGATRYKVLAKQGGDQKFLAPRVNKDAVVSKESLLKRKRAAVAVNKKRGFFVKR